MLTTKKIKEESRETLYNALIIERLDRITRMSDSLLLSEEQFKAIDRLVEEYGISFNNVTTEEENDDTRRAYDPAFVVLNILERDRMYRVLLKNHQKQVDEAAIDRVYDSFLKNGLGPNEETETDNELAFYDDTIVDTIIEIIETPWIEENTRNMRAA